MDLSFDELIDTISIDFPQLESYTEYDIYDEMFVCFVDNQDTFKLIFRIIDDELYLVEETIESYKEDTNGCWNEFCNIKICDIVKLLNMWIKYGNMNVGGKWMKELLD